MAGTFDRFIAGSVRGRTYARIVVKAVDIVAARLLARKHLRRTLDAINFYSDLWTRGIKLYLPGEAASHTHWSLEFRTSSPPKFTCESTHAGPFPAYSVADLQSHAAGFGWGRISQVLENKKRSDLEERILSAVEWAGRATVDDRKEESFLSFAIALEVLLLGRKVESELTHRLATRGAHLLMSDFTGRRNVQKDLRELYKTRSRIVHSGNLMVTEGELGRIRFLAKTALVIALTHERFLSMQSEKELDNWFEDEALKGSR